MASASACAWVEDPAWKDVLTGTQHAGSKAGPVVVKTRQGTYTLRQLRLCLFDLFCEIPTPGVRTFLARAICNARAT